MSKKNYKKSQSRGQNNRSNQRSCDQNERTNLYSNDEESMDKKKQNDKRYASGSKTRINRNRPNDPKFYYNSEANIKPFANLPFNNVSGLTTQYNYDACVTALSNITGTDLSIPGILTSHFIPTFGWSDNAQSPINVAALKTYAFMRHDNSGASNYDAVNYAQYSLAVSGLVPLITHVRRALTSVVSYSSTSRYMPDDLIYAMGFDASDLRKHWAEYVGRFNLLIQKFNAFHVPINVKTILRWDWMCANIFVDRESVKAQMYMFIPVAYPYYYDVSEAGTPEVVWKAWQTNPGSLGSAMYSKEIMSDVMDKLEKAIAQLFGSDSIGIMSGDTLKAFGPDNILRINPISGTETTNFVYSKEALWQFNNIQTLPWTTYQRSALQKILTKEVLTQLIGSCSLAEVVDPDTQTSYLQTRPCVSFFEDSEAELIGGFKGLGSRSIMNIDVPTPTFEDVLEITRTKSLSTLSYNTYSQLVYLDAISTEIYVFNQITYLCDAIPRAFTSFEDVTSISDMTSDISVLLAELSAFDWHPGLSLVYPNEFDETTGKVTLPLMEYDNAVSLNAEDLKTINYAINQEMFGI